MIVEPRAQTIVALVVSAASFMQSLDSTVITTALPKMAESFHVGPVDLSIGITAYILALATMAPVSGWLAGRLGARSVFASAIAVFVLASVLCGAARGLWPFVAARVLQGIGGSMMLPVGQLILLRATPKADLVRAITLATTPALMAPVVGPPIGGFLTTFVGWPWIFYLNVPLGVAGIACSLLLLPNPVARERPPFDVTGFILNGTAIATLVYGIGELGSAATGRSAAIALVAGLALLAAAIQHARRHPAPLLPLRALHLQTFRAMILTGGSLLRLQVRVIPFVVPLLLQVGFGMSAFVSGSILVAHTAGDVMLKTVTTRTLRLLGFRRTLLVFTVLFALSVAALALITRATPVWAMVALLGVSGAFRSPLFTALSTLAYAELAPVEMAGATALANVIQQVTGAVSIALVALVLNAAVAFRGGQPGTPTIDDFRLVLLLGGLTALLSVLPFARLPPDAGAELSRHKLHT